MNNPALSIEFQDGNKIELLFSSDKECELSINDSVKYLFNLYSEKGDINITQKTIYSTSTAINSGLNIVNIERIELANFPVNILTNCISCNGNRYCITNGCTNTPCGWICDNCC
ncbi:hypothetical protein [Spirosoma lituiforme]